MLDAFGPWNVFVETPGEQREGRPGTEPAPGPPGRSIRRSGGGHGKRPLPPSGAIPSSGRPDLHPESDHPGQRPSRPTGQRPLLSGLGRRRWPTASGTVPTPSPIRSASPSARPPSTSPKTWATSSPTSRGPETGRPPPRSWPKPAGLSWRSGIRAGPGASAPQAPPPSATPRVSPESVRTPRNAWKKSFAWWSTTTSRASSWSTGTS